MAKIVILVCLLPYMSIEVNAQRSSANAESSSGGDTFTGCWKLAGMVVPAVLHQSDFPDLIKRLVVKGNTTATATSAARDCLSKISEKLPHPSFSLSVAALVGAMYLNIECRNLAIIASDVEKDCTALKREAEALVHRATREISANHLKKNSKDQCTSLKQVLRDCKELAGKLQAQILRINDLLEESLWNKGWRWAVAAAAEVGPGLGVFLHVIFHVASPLAWIVAVPVAIWLVPDPQEVLEAAKEECVRAQKLIVNELIHTIKDQMANLSCEY